MFFRERIARSESCPFGREYNVSSGTELFSAIYQTRDNKAARQNDDRYSYTLLARCVRRRRDVRFSSAGAWRNIRSNSLRSSNDIPQLRRIFSRSTPEHRERRSLPLSISRPFFPHGYRFATIARAQSTRRRQLARGSLSLGNAFAISESKNRPSGKKYKETCSLSLLPPSMFFSLGFGEKAAVLP